MSYNTALAFTLKQEGGYSDNPSDHGGPTNFGITQRVYDAHRSDSGLPPVAVRSISYGEVAAIYRCRYWDAVRCDQLPGPVDLVCFDSAVNSGPSRAAKWLQKSLGVAVDGDVGPKTLAALEHRDPVNVALSILQLREDFCRHLAVTDPSQNQFFKGWLNRINALRKLVKL